MNTRIVMTADTAASTIAPRTPALQVPITSSITKITEEMGALKAAAMPAAAPTGMRRRRLRGERLPKRPRVLARPQQICTVGPSRPNDAPDPI